MHFLDPVAQTVHDHPPHLHRYALLLSFGWVGYATHYYEALSRENEALKRKVEDLEEALRRGRKRAGGKDTDPAEVVKGFEGLMKKQAEQFQALMESYGKMYEVKKPGKERKATHTTETSNKRG